MRVLPDSPRRAASWSRAHTEKARLLLWGSTAGAKALPSHLCCLAVHAHDAVLTRGPHTASLTRQQARLLGRQPRWQYPFLHWFCASRTWPPLAMWALLKGGGAGGCHCSCESHCPGPQPLPGPVSWDGSEKWNCSWTPAGLQPQGGGLGLGRATPGERQHRLGRVEGCGCRASCRPGAARVSCAQRHLVPGIQRGGGCTRHLQCPLARLFVSSGVWVLVLGTFGSILDPQLPS